MVKDKPVFTFTRVRPWRWVVSGFSPSIGGRSKEERKKKSVRKSIQATFYKWRDQDRVQAPATQETVGGRLGALAAFTFPIRRLAQSCYFWW